MPKGRGANERRRTPRQKRPKSPDLSGAPGKIESMRIRAIRVAAERRERSPHSKAVMVLVDRWEGEAAKRRLRRSKWSDG